MAAKVKPGDIARMTQRMRGGMLAAHRRQRSFTVADTAGTINVWQDGRHAYRVTATFTGGGVYWAGTRRAAERLAASAGRWWRRHQDQYLADLACVQDPGDGMPRGWQPPRRRV